MSSQNTAARGAVKVYIAGKITGDAGYREKFAAAEQKLQGEGFIVLSPAVLPEGMSTADYMRICFAMIDVADKVAFFAHKEGLDAHAKSAVIRFEDKK